MVRKTVTYLGKVRNLPTDTSFGDIIADDMKGKIAFFDKVALKRAKTPPPIKRGSLVKFKISGSGRAIGLLSLGKKK